MIQGKSIFNWNVPMVLNGNPHNFAMALIDAGFDTVWLKGGEGNTIFKQPLWRHPTWGVNIKQELIDTLRSYGIKFCIWGFLYGYDPKGELDIAKRLCDEFEPDGYIFDVESRFDAQPLAEANARLISKGLKQSHPNVPQGLCWWALPKNPEKMSVEWHPVRVGKAFLETVDVLIPMMYWNGRSSLEAQIYLQRSLNVWDTIAPGFPMIPVGRAYTGDNGTIDPNAIKDFALQVMRERVEKNFVGISWWSFEHAIKVPDCWTALKYTPKFKTFVYDNSKLSGEEVIKRLATEHPYLFPELYVNE